MMLIINDFIYKVPNPIHLAWDQFDSPRILVWKVLNDPPNGPNGSKTIYFNEWNKFKYGLGDLGRFLEVWNCWPPQP